MIYHNLLRSYFPDIVFTMTDQEFLQEVGASIAQVRKAKGLSQVDVCAKLNMDKPYLSAIENGHQNITLLTCKQIAEALEVEVRELVVSTE